ncbi:MAG: hypothetical protein MUC51_07200 [Anaerolineae bacterium]|nr:hypothetical protein [Anaerolineae bacterium]
MSRAQLDSLLAQIRAMREQTLAETAGLTEADFALPTDMHRWDDLRRVLLRFGDHMREHASQAQAARVAAGHAPTPPERMLAEAELAWGMLLGVTVGLSDEDARTQPPHPWTAAGRSSRCSNTCSRPRRPT